MKVPFIDLIQSYKSTKSEISRNVKRVFESQRFVLGDFGRDLESQFAKATGSRFAIGVASGSDALYLSLLALGIGKGDEVITTPFTFFATASAITRTGAKPVFVDTALDTFNMDTRLIEKKITTRTKAILPVPLFGLMSDMKALRAIAKKHHLFIVEDAAQSYGAMQDGKAAGAYGDLGCFSFYPTKNLSGAGDGGMITTSDRRLADALKLWRAHGSAGAYRHSLIGINSRLDELQAAVLLVKLKYIDKLNEKRIQHAEYYNQALKNLPIQLPKAPKGYKHVFHLYSILTKKSAELSQHLSKKGIGSGVYYPLPLHLQECFKYLGYKKGDFPKSEKAAREILSLPMYPELSQKEKAYVARSVADFFL